MNQSGLIVGISEKPKSLGRWIILSLQHVFAMFGATVLVPIINGVRCWCCTCCKWYWNTHLHCMYKS